MKHCRSPLITAEEAEEAARFWAKHPKLAPRPKGLRKRKRVVILLCELEVTDEGESGTIQEALIRSISEEEIDQLLPERRRQAKNEPGVEDWRLEAIENSFWLERMSSLLHAGTVTSYLQ